MGGGSREPQPVREGPPPGSIGLSIWMTRVAAIAVIYIGRDLRMLVVHAVLIVWMTGETGEFRVVGRINVARLAATPFSLVLP